MVGSQPDIAVTILTLLNPATISSFVVWFGACGLFAWRLMPFLPVNFTLPIALLGGLLGTKVTLTLLGVLVSKMYSSGSFTQQSLIGYEAEVTVGFTAQQTGEITCATGGPRYTLSARCFDAKDAFKRGARVIIADICDDVAFVQALPDELKPWEPDAANGSTIAIAPAPESIEPTTDPQP